MEVKKNPKVDQEKNKSIFFQLGLVIALTVIFFGFNYKKYDKQNNDWEQLVVTQVTEEEIEITKQEEPKQQPQQVSTTVLQIVEDDVVVNDDLDINAEDDQNSTVGDYVAPIETDDEPKFEEQEIFTIVEETAEFPGGEEGLFKFLSDNVKYPTMARESNVSGTVFVTFVVEPDGSVSNVKLLRGIGGGCDEEAMRVVKQMPRWKAGKQRGRPVRQQYNLPIKFTLTN